MRKADRQYGRTLTGGSSKNTPGTGLVGRAGQLASLFPADRSVPSLTDPFSLSRLRRRAGGLAKNCPDSCQTVGPEDARDLGSAKIRLARVIARPRLGGDCPQAVSLWKRSPCGRIQGERGDLPSHLGPRIEQVDHAMGIEFLCPNGHKIAAADDRANKPAKCPKWRCQVLRARPGGIRAVPSPAPGRQPPFRRRARRAADSSQMASRDQIEFLCPNGHRVWAAVGLQGRPPVPNADRNSTFPRSPTTGSDLRATRRRTRSSISRISPPRSRRQLVRQAVGVLPLAGQGTLFRSLRQGQPGGRLPHPPGRRPARGGNARTVDPRRKRCSARNSSQRNSATVRRWLYPSRPRTTPTPCFCFRGRRSRGSKSVELNASRRNSCRPVSFGAVSPSPATGIAPLELTRPEIAVS